MALDWSAEPQTPLVVNGVRLEYAAFGPKPGEAPTIVMLHEGLGCVALWRDFPERLARATGYGVFVYSRQGHGASDLSILPKSIDAYEREALDVLPRILDAAGVRQAILLGHSDGATIAAIYAGSVSDFRVRGLVLIAPHFFTEETGLAEIQKAAQAYETGDLKERMARRHRDPDNTFHGWSGVWLKSDFVSWDITEVIDYFRVPCLALQGAQDQYGTKAQIEVIADRSYAPVELHLLENCRHAPHLEQPDQTLNLVADFAVRLQRIETTEVSLG